MAKKSISVTLEESTIENLRLIADEEMRSVSNLIDYIVAQYAKKINITSSASRLENAIEFGKRIIVTDYKETVDTLKNNVFLDNEDKEYIAGKE